MTDHNQNRLVNRLAAELVRQNKPIKVYFVDNKTFFLIAAANERVILTGDQLSGLQRTYEIERIDSPAPIPEV